MKCEICDREMMEVDSCLKVPIESKDGTTFDPIPFGSAPRDDGFERCPDCNVAVGGYHHVGCDWETCPICGGQLISCDCY